MSIAAAVLDAVRAEADLHGGAHVSRAGLRIGELSGVEPESLRFCLETLVTGDPLAPLAFDLEIRPWTRRCRDCGVEFRVVEYNPACAACGSVRTEAAGGDEMELSYLELEEPACASPSNEKS
jgi:hydrogenase nickel incorporation protein HypA/HybF